jgi:hypothetical protein
MLATSTYSGILAVMSFLPILERAFLSLAIMKDRPTKNLLFFADIARHPPADYLTKNDRAVGSVSV